LPAHARPCCCRAGAHCPPRPTWSHHMARWVTHASSEDGAHTSSPAAMHEPLCCTRVGLHRHPHIMQSRKPCPISFFHQLQHTCLSICGRLTTRVSACSTGRQPAQGACTMLAAGAEETLEGSTWAARAAARLAPSEGSPRQKSVGPSACSAAQTPSPGCRSCSTTIGVCGSASHLRSCAPAAARLSRTGRTAAAGMARAAASAA